MPGEQVPDLLEGEAPKETLPFSVAKQEALIGHLLLNRPFWEQAKSQIQRDWFNTPQSVHLFGAIQDYSKRVGTCPTREELEESHELMLVSQGERSKLITYIVRCLGKTVEYSLKDITIELTDWMHARIYHVAVQKSALIFNSAQKAANPKVKYEESYRILREMNRKIDDISFEQGTRESFDNPQDEMERLKKEMQRAITFGHRAIDKMLLPEGVNGSLLRGDTTILLAPTNVGKTTCMITIACANIKMGKSVLLITHEGRPQDIKLKIWQCMTGATRSDVFASMGTEHGKKVFEELAIVLREHLVYIPLNKAGLTVEELEVVIRQQHEKWAATHKGEGFDLVIDDYMANMTTAQARGGQFARRQIDEVVYNYGIQLALEYNFHFLTAIQTNREGSRVNRKEKGETRLLTMEDVLESWGVMTKATNVISLNRDVTAKAGDRITFHICKSRSSETEWAIVCKSNYPAALTHYFTLPATIYRSTTNLSRRIDDLLRTNGSTDGYVIPVADVEAMEKEEWGQKQWKPGQI